MPYVIYVVCPKCYNEQITTSFKQKRCVYCGHSFIIFPQNSRPRISRIEGNIKEFQLDYLRWKNGK